MVYSTSIMAASSPDTYDMYEAVRERAAPLPTDPCQIPGDNNMVSYWWIRFKLSFCMLRFTVVLLLSCLFVNLRHIDAADSNRIYRA